MLSKISKVMELRSVYSWNMSTGSGRAKSHPWSTCLATWQPSKFSGGTTTFSRNFMWASAHVFSNRSQLSLFFFIGSKFWCLPLVGLEQQWLGSRSCAGHSKGCELSNFKPTRSQSLQAQDWIGSRDWSPSPFISIFYSSHSDHPKMSQFNAPEQWVSQPSRWRPSETLWPPGRRSSDSSNASRHGRPPWHCAAQQRRRRRCLGHICRIGRWDANNVERYNIYIYMCLYRSIMIMCNVYIYIR